jgi:helix-turn-helix protein
MCRATEAYSKQAKLGAGSSPSFSFMSIKVSTEIWEGSKHKSGNLLVLLALADHADDRGTAWPGIALLARKARLSQRHTRRCLSELVASGELEILPNQAPSGRALYRIRLDKLESGILSAETSASDEVTPVSVTPDATDRAVGPPYIEEPSTESSEEPTSKIKIDISNPKNPPGKKHSYSPDAIGLVSSPKSGF